MSKPEHQYVAFVSFEYGNGSWAYGETPEQAAERAAKWAKRDWAKHYQFERKHTFNTAVYALNGCEEWYRDWRGDVRDAQREDVILPFVGQVQAIA